MKSRSSDRPPADAPAATALKRRSVLLGAGAAGAAAIAAGTLPIAPQPAPADPAQSKDEPAAGYRLTQHVLRYYETAKV